MIIAVPLILGASVIVGATLVAKYWRKIVDFLKKALTKLKQIIKGTIMGSAVFLKRIGDKFQNRTKHYSQNEQGKWKETIVCYEQDADEIPEKYREYAGFDQEVDLTEELQLQLEKK